MVFGEVDRMHKFETQVDGGSFRFEISLLCITPSLPHVAKLSTAISAAGNSVNRSGSTAIVNLKELRRKTTPLAMSSDISQLHDHGDATSLREMSSDPYPSSSVPGASLRYSSDDMAGFTATRPLSAALVY
jgi:hypothetical protein